MDVTREAQSRQPAEQRPVPAIARVAEEWASRISVRDLDFFYGDARALKSISLEIPERRITGLIGPSGCGKSTLLRVLNRMYDLYPGQRATGEVLMDGRNLIAPDVDVNELRSRVGMVFQKPTPFPMSISENIAFGVRLHERLSKPRMAERVEWALSRAALWNEVKDRLAQSALSLSGGQQQRLVIARTIAIRPEVLLFDEPTSALDPLGRADVRDLVLSLKERGVAVLLNSHLIGEVERVCDRVVVLDRGRVAAAGTLAELLGRRELHLRLDGVGPAAEARLATTGAVTRRGGEFTVALPADDDGTAVPGLIADLVALGVRVHAVEPARISLEDKLLSVLRHEGEAAS